MSDLLAHHIQRDRVHYKIVDLDADSITSSILSDLQYRQKIVTLMEERQNSETITVEEIKALLGHLTRDRRWTLVFHP